MSVLIKWAVDINVIAYRDLSHNSITDVPHGVFKTPHGLSHIRELNLGYNEIGSLETGMFEGLTSLKKL